VLKQPYDTKTVSVDFAPLLGTSGAIVSQVLSITDEGNVTSVFSTASIIGETVVRWRITGGVDGELVASTVQVETSQGTIREAVCMVEVIDHQIISGTAFEAASAFNWDDITGVIGRWDFNDFSNVLIGGDELFGQIGGSISRVKDLSGSGLDADLIQSLDSWRPTIVDDEGLHVAEFDGTDDRLLGAWLTGNVVQPFTMIFVVKATSLAATVPRYMWDGIASGAEAQLRLADGTSELIMDAGTDMTGDFFNVNVTRIISCVYNGAGSSLFVNGGNQQAFGNVGTQALGGMTLGADRLTAAFFRGYVKYGVVLDGVVSVDDHNAIGEWLANRYGIVWTEAPPAVP